VKTVATIQPVFFDDEGDDRPLNASDRGADGDRERDRDEPGIVVARAGELELGDGDAGDAAHVPDREVDLADEEHEDDTDGDHRDAGHLPDQVREVDCGEEDVRLRREEERDRDDPDDHGQAAHVAALQRVPATPHHRAEALVLRGRDLDFCRRRRAHAASVASGLPTVIAWTISCAFVLPVS
jgi:hypothetical protein